MERDQFLYRHPTDHEKITSLLYEVSLAILCLSYTYSVENMVVETVHEDYFSIRYFILPGNTGMSQVQTLND